MIDHSAIFCEMLLEIAVVIYQKPGWLNRQSGTIKQAQMKNCCIRLLPKVLEY